MKSQKINFYFILYLIAVISIFAATGEKEKAISEAIKEKNMSEERLKQLQMLYDAAAGTYLTPPQINVTFDGISQSSNGSDTKFTFKVSRKDNPIDGDITEFDAPVSPGWGGLRLTPVPDAPNERMLIVPISGDKVNSTIRLSLRVKRDVSHNASVPDSLRSSIQSKIDHATAATNGWFVSSQSIPIKYFRGIVHAKRCKAHDREDCPICNPS